MTVIFSEFPRRHGTELVPKFWKRAVLGHFFFSMNALYNIFMKKNNYDKYHGACSEWPLPLGQHWSCSNIISISEFDGTFSVFYQLHWWVWVMLVDQGTSCSVIFRTKTPKPYRTNTKHENRTFVYEVNSSLVNRQLNKTVTSWKIDAANLILWK